MPLKHHRRVHGVKRKFYGGKLRVVHHPTKHPRVRTLLYRDNVTNLSGPIVGGGDIMKRLSKAMSSFGVSKHHRRVHGGAIGVL